MKKMNKILDYWYDELMLEISYDQVVKVLDTAYNTQYIDNIIRGKLEASMIFKTQESIKMDDVME